jgi:hypothetical protein
MPANVFFQVIDDASVKTVVPEPRLIIVIEREDWRSPIMASFAIITSLKAYEMHGRPFVE